MRAPPALLGLLLVRSAAATSTALAPYNPAAVIQPYDVAERRFRFGHAGNITMRQAAGSGLASSLSTVMWDAGFVLARHLDTLAASGALADASVVELGAGLGLPSIVAALGGAAPVLATDGDAQCLPLLSANAERAGASVLTRALRWDEAEAALALNGGRRFDVVLAADVVYAGNAGAAWRALLKALRLLAAPGASILLAQTIRYGDAHDAFLRLARRRGFAVETLPPDRDAGGGGDGGGDALAGKVLIYRLRPRAEEAQEECAAVEPTGDLAGT